MTDIPRKTNDIKSKDPISDEGFCVIAEVNTLSTMAKGSKIKVIFQNFCILHIEYRDKIGIKE